LPIAARIAGGIVFSTVDPVRVSSYLAASGLAPAIRIKFALENPPDSQELNLEDYGWGPHFQEQLTGADAGLLAVRVMMVHRDALDVAGPGFEGRIAGLTRRHSENTATTGDWLLIDASRTAVRVLERHSVLKRKAAGRGRSVQRIAANVDTLFVVTSANQEFNLARIERYLALAAESGATPVVLITKADLSDDVSPFVEAVQDLHPGLAVTAINAKSPAVGAALALWLARGKTVALLGSSGVGKSTLVNTLMGEDLQTTQGSRVGGDKGRHTTSARSLHRLANGAWLMDTPGIRELQLLDAAQGVDDVFDDLAALAANCKFSNCRHESEPGCAVQEAVAAGEIDELRLLRYQKLQGEERINSRAIADAKNRAPRGMG
jgi:ribosome biogenesis GTPase